ncbi:SGNH/GDSL hydrolase family protein [Planococcus shenhongbingii]|uniref:SGNH/GDSL hydrolase family protein n=1 Tax=Planococcus shenhongbingii TaxID=3058398 RepID=A0ABT8NGK7_9BACL|nr:SGNH/GDSL hydrolase family protein [Planococcus sp. N017]MDN7247032.1 SGNH/GDSL hydrolase family protein [Planococcus sp. N017]
MNKLFKIFTAVLIALSLGTPSAFAKSDQGKESLVALGDSIPFGYNLSQKNNNPAKIAFPSLLADEADLRVRNLGVPGWQTQDLLTALETNQKFRQAVSHADYVTVNIGNNDFLDILRTANAESGGNPLLFRQLLAQKLSNSDVFANVADIIEEIRTLTDAPIVLYNIYNPFQVNDPLHQVADQFLPQINAAFAGIANAYSSGVLADAYSAFGDNQAQYVLPGDIHPTAAGQQVLAEIGLQALNANYVNN